MIWSMMEKFVLQDDEEVNELKIEIPSHPAFLKKALDTVEGKEIIIEVKDDGESD